MNETKRTVGRPKGKAHRKSDAAKIRAVLVQYGLTYPTAKVKKVLASRNNVAKPEERINVEATALSVKIAQVRSTMIAEVTGVVRAKPGRRTKLEQELVEAKLALAAAQREAA